MSNETQPEQKAEQKLLKLEEAMIAPRIVVPDENKGMVPVTFIPPTIQQTTQADAGHPVQQVTSGQQTTTAQQSTTTQQAQSSGQSQSSESGN